MDQELVDHSIEHHGAALVDQLASEQVDVRLPNFLSFSKPRNEADGSRDEAFHEKMCRFIARKADMLFSSQRSRLGKLIPQLENEDHFAVVPPIEAFMDIPGDKKREHFYQCIQHGDVVVGLVTGLSESGLHITLLCMDNRRARDIDQLKVTAFCPVREIPRIYPHQDPVESFNVRDHVRGVVMAVPRDMSDKIVISFQARSLPAGCDLELGLIDTDDLPLHYSHLQTLGGQTYSSFLQRSSGFANPKNVTTLMLGYGLAETTRQPSLMRGLSSLQWPESQFADKLRKTQSYRWALKSVAEGIKHFKEGRQVEAMQYLNKALQIDEENVEALVARGALYANNESYQKAIEDFEVALKFNPDHGNAKKYMCETLVAHAREMFLSGEASDAKAVIEQALEMNPDLPEARSVLDQIQMRLKIKVLLLYRMLSQSVSLT